VLVPVAALKRCFVLNTSPGNDPAFPIRNFGRAGRRTPVTSRVVVRHEIGACALRWRSTMASHGNSARRIRAEELRVDPTAQPRWVNGATRDLEAGVRVYCTDGMAEVVRVLGKTQNGSRLLELKVDDGRRAPFFAAASNVLVSPQKKG